MTDEKVSAIRARLKFSTQEAFAAGYARYISAGGIFIPMSPSRLKQRGERVRFQFMLADGANALLGEGVVHQVHRSTTAGTPVGILVKFTRLSQSSKSLIDRIVAQKAATHHHASAQEDAPQPREETTTPHTQVAIDRIAELYSSAEEGGLEEDTRVAPDLGDDATPTRAIEQQEQARMARQGAAAPRDTAQEDRSIEHSQLHTQSEINEEVEASEQVLRSDESARFEDEATGEWEEETSPEGSGASGDPELPQEDEAWTQQPESRSVDDATGSRPTPDPVAFLPLEGEGAPSIAVADDAPTSLDRVRESRPQDVLKLSVPATPPPPPPPKAVLPPPPLFASKALAPAGLQRLSEGSIEASEFESTDFVMDPDELDDFFPSAGSNLGLFNSSPPPQSSSLPPAQAPPRTPDKGGEPVGVAAPQSASSPSGPARLGSTEGGLQVLAYDDASRDTNLDAISLGEEEGDIDLLFEGIFSGGQEGEEEEDFFANVFASPASESQEDAIQRAQAPSEELISLLDAIDEPLEPSEGIPRGSSTPSIQLQHSLDGPALDPNLHFNLPEKSSVSEVDVLEDVLGKEAFIVPQESQHVPTPPPLVPKKKKGLLSKFFNKEE